MVKLKMLRKGGAGVFPPSALTAQVLLPGYSSSGGLAPFNMVLAIVSKVWRNSVAYTSVRGCSTQSGTLENNSIEHH